MHEDILEEQYNKRFNLKLWQKILAYAKPYYLQLSLLILLMLILAVFTSAVPALSKYAIDHFAVTKKTDGLLLFGVVVLLMVIIRGYFVRILIVISGKINTYISFDIRKKAFDHIQNLSFSYFDKKPVGWLISRLTSDSSVLGGVLSWGIIDLIWGFSMMLIMSGFMLYLNVNLSLIVLGVVPLLAFATFKFQSLILNKSRDVRKINSEITGAFNEGITGAKTTKTLVRESANLQEFSILTEKMYDSSIGVARYSAVYFPIIIFLGAVGTAGVIWYGGNGIISEDITYGTLVAFTSYAVSFFYPLEDLARRLPEIQNAQVAGERIFSLIDTEPEIKDSPEVLAKYGEDAENRETLPEFVGNIEFEKVSFLYKKNEVVLDDFNLEVKAGETIALVGETGSGKSTIVNLVARFYEPESGRILIDGNDYSEIPLEWLQSQLGIVQQNPHLFSGSIADNISYGKPGASRDEIVRAAKLIHADEFIHDLGGYDFEVGENGSRISTGQKQLISLARVMLADPKLLILDEATSSIDTETEMIIQKAIDHVTVGRTSFIIAHRLSTIRSADRILFIDKGKIVEEGTHHELLLKNGFYYDLYSSQFVLNKETQMLK